ncbi:dipeptidylpeptidase [Dinochytrium kinnereticum]|nr:dipeptidylpeptidase [Dinochytrium kinnereticum]
MVPGTNNVPAGPAPPQAHDHQSGNRLSWDGIRARVREFHSSQAYFHTTLCKDFVFDDSFDRIYFLSNVKGNDQKGNDVNTPGRFMNLMYMETSSARPQSVKQRRHQRRSQAMNFNTSMNETNGDVGASERSLISNDCRSYPFQTSSRQIAPSLLTQDNSFIDSQPILASGNGNDPERSFQGNKSERKSLEVKPILTESWLKAQMLSGTDVSSLEEMMVKERKRLPSTQQGISIFQLWKGSEHNGIMFPLGNEIFHGVVSKDIGSFFPKSIPFKRSVPRLDVKLGGRDGDLVAFTLNRDIWVSSLDGQEIQLTLKSNPSISNGVAEYIMQEEFHRFTGYWWAPSDVISAVKLRSGEDIIEKILYLEVDESQVDFVCIARPGLDGAVDKFRYPRVGKANATADIKVVSFNSTLLKAGNQVAPVIRGLHGLLSLKHLFPWIEYIPRVGWLPDGLGIWAQLLNRSQRRSVLIEIPLEAFMTMDEYHLALSSGSIPSIIILCDERSDCWINVTDVVYFMKTPSSCSREFIWGSERTGFRHLYHFRTTLDKTKPLGLDGLVVPSTAVRKITSGFWPVVDHQIWVDEAAKLVYFVGKADTPLEGHLYVSSYDERSTAEVIMSDWDNASSESSSPPHFRNYKRLTKLGQSHLVTLNEPCTLFISNSSSVSERPHYELHLITRPPIPNHSGTESQSHSFTYHTQKRYHLAHDPSHPQGLSEATGNIDSVTSPHFVPTKVNSVESIVEDEASASIVGHKRRSSSSKYENRTSTGSCEPSILDQSTATFVSPVLQSHSPTGTLPSHWNPEFFSFVNSDGIELFGMVYKPRGFKEGKKYPVIVRIYGGPNVQVVTNDYKLPKFMRVFLALQFGYVVVLVDSRGSYDRGLAFEGHIKNKLGTVELKDQIEALLYLSTRHMNTTEMILESPLFQGMSSWDVRDAWKRLVEASSDGISTGFMDPLRVGITGWSYGGYLSLMALAQYPEIFKVAISGAPVTSWELYDAAYTERYMGLLEENPDGYHQGSVLNYVDRFPESDCRLLIVHGSIDENVHFKNTEALVAELVRSSKPHRMQVYPGERHGLRAPNVVEHFETLMMWTLLTAIPL